MAFLNIAGYQFMPLGDLPALRAHLFAAAKAHGLKGTILLSPEGVNLMLAGRQADVQAFLDILKADQRFAEMGFHRSFSEGMAFDRLKVKIRREIITLRHSSANPLERRAPAVTPAEFRRWLDDGRPMTVLDTRNDFEVRLGAFTGAVNPGLSHFGAFPKALAALPKDQPVVTYCTGGIRCEKAALLMMDAGFKEVWQLEGGILGYFAAEGSAHYEGDCFVFDQRVTVNAGDFR